MQSIYERGNNLEEQLRGQQGAATPQVLPVRYETSHVSWIAQRGGAGKNGDAAPYAGR